MTYERQQSTDIYATLALSQEEARDGTTRTLNLPGGRQFTASVPPGIGNGQELRFEGQGLPDANTGTPGALILTIAVAPPENFGSQFYPQQDADFPTEFLQPPPPVPTTRSFDYPSVGQTAVSTNYPSQGRGTAYWDQTQQAQQYAPSQQYSPPQQYLPPQPPQRRRAIGLTILIIVIVLLVIAGSGLIYYATVYRPNQIHAQATSTAVAKVTGTAQSNATASAQARATTQAQANATSTAQAQTQAQATGTATALQNVYTQATSSNPVVNDPLTQQDANWEVDTKEGGGGCAFTGGAYHASMPQTGFFSSCYAQGSNFSNFAFQVDMKILKGDRGGLIFRSDSTGNKFYLLRVGQDGTYDLFVYTSNSGGTAKSILHNSTDTLHTGHGPTNKIAVIAQGSNIYLYFNQQYVANVTDPTYSTGSIGVFAEDGTNPTEVAFNNAQIWKL